MERIYLATERGLIIGRYEDGHWRESGHFLQDIRLTSVVFREPVVLAGSSRGAFRSVDNGLSWQQANSGLIDHHVRWLVGEPHADDLVLAGTEPAGVYVSSDGGLSWLQCPEVTKLRIDKGWFLPYSPEAGCVRDFAVHGNRVYAAVEVGGLLRSDDRGVSWQLAAGSDGVPRWGEPSPGFIHPDVHSVAVHDSSADLVYAPTGGGLFVSLDAGENWDNRYRGCYCRAVWVDSTDPRHLVLGPADGVDRNGRIEESYDWGRSWTLMGNDLNSLWPGHMVERFTQAGDWLLAALSNGTLIGCILNSRNWRPVLPDVGGVNCVAA